MFSKLAIVIVASLGALSVSATTYSCNTGAVQCCNSVQNSGSYDVTKIASLLGVVVGEITGQIALQCSPATVIGAGTGASCGSEPVCCEKNFSAQLIGVNCSPANVVL